MLWLMANSPCLCLYLDVYFYMGCRRLPALPLSEYETLPSKEM